VLAEHSDLFSVVINSVAGVEVSSLACEDFKKLVCLCGDAPADFFLDEGEFCLELLLNIWCFELFDDASACEEEEHNDEEDDECCR